MRFSKWHALGNSYLVVERGDAAALSADRVRRLCDVDRGIGADGIVEIESVEGALAHVLIWNPDGSAAEMSGNGTRIAARWLASRIATAEVFIAVGTREVAARIVDDVVVETDLGQVTVGPPETIDVAGNALELTPVSVGNPHAVVRREELSREVLLRLGPLIERHPRFPGRTNVQLVRPDGPHEVQVLVWERGAGETAASGSSAVAVAAAAVTEGWCESPVTVRMPGGDLLVRLEGVRATLIGPTELICTGESTV